MIQWLRLHLPMWWAGGETGVAGRVRCRFDHWLGSLDPTCPEKKTQNIKQKQYFDKFSKDSFFNCPL